MGRKVTSGVIGLAMLAAALAVPVSRAEALSPDIVISQVYGGGGNSGAPYSHDFVELFNRGTTAVSLAGWSVQYASATGAGTFGDVDGTITALGGILEPGQYLLVKEASSGASGSALPAADVTDSNPINLSGVAGKVALVTSTTGLGCNGGSTPCSAAQLASVKDLVGWGGANFFETAAAPTTSNVSAVLRLAGGCTETDDNSADFVAGPPAPRNMSSPRFPCAVADAAPSVTGSTPADGASAVAVDANLSVTFSEPVDVTPAAFTLVCSVSGNVTTAVSGGPTTFTVDPDGSLANDEACTLTVVAAQVSDQDTNDPPDTMTRDVTIGFRTEAGSLVDSDGDGVSDSADLCPATELAEPAPPAWKKNRYIADANGDFVDVGGRNAGTTIADSRGCTGAQIIEAAGLGEGHLRFGITRSALLDWTASNTA